MRFKLDINCDGAAFADRGASSEVARLLRLADNRLRHGETEGTLLDLNGNSVGTWGFTESDNDHQPTRVVDADGDIWTRAADGTWVCTDADPDDPDLTGYQWLTRSNLAHVEADFGISEVLS